MAKWFWIWFSGSVVYYIMCKYHSFKECDRSLSYTYTEIAVRPWSKITNIEHATISSSCSICYKVRQLSFSRLSVCVLSIDICAFCKRKNVSWDRPDELVDRAKLHYSRAVCWMSNAKIDNPTLKMGTDKNSTLKLQYVYYIQWDTIKQITLRTWILIHLTIWFT